MRASVTVDRPEHLMESLSLPALTDELLTTARQTNGRAARTVRGGHDHALRQVVSVLTAGHDMNEHDSPGEATLQVLTGRVRLIAGEESWEGAAGGFVVVPSSRHRVEALEDSAILLTVLAVGAVRG